MKEQVEQGAENHERTDRSVPVQNMEKYEVD